MRRLGPITLMLAACSSGPAPAERPQVAQPRASAPASEPLIAVGFAAVGTDRCERKRDGSFADPLQRSYGGVLRNARCETQAFFTMASLAKTLGVECRHCHVADPGDAKKEIYTSQTERMRITNWMLANMVEGLRTRDGGAVECESCHVGPDGKPLAKVLGDPRDPVQTLDFMKDVIVARFVKADGTPFTCASCHGATAPDQPGWNDDVIPFESTPPGSATR